MLHIENIFSTLCFVFTYYVLYISAAPFYIALNLRIQADGIDFVNTDLI